LDDKTSEYILLENKYAELQDQCRIIADQKVEVSSRLRDAVTINDTLKNKIELEIEDLLIDKDRLISDLRHQLEVKSRQIESIESARRARDNIYVQEQAVKITERPSESSENPSYPTEHYYKEERESGIGEFVQRVKQLGIKLDDFGGVFAKICTKVGIQCEIDYNLSDVLESCE
jgi:hypothetical protein